MIRNHIDEQHMYFNRVFVTRQASSVQILLILKIVLSAGVVDISTSVLSDRSKQSLNLHNSSNSFIKIDRSTAKNNFKSTLHSTYVLNVVSAPVSRGSPPIHI